MYLDKDFSKARDYYSLAARSVLFSYENSGIIINTRIPSSCFFILSDNNNLIDVYKNLPFDNEFDYQLAHQFHSFSQAVLSEDEEKMEKYSMLFRETSEKENKEYFPFSPLLEGIRKLDQNLIVSSLPLIFKTAKKRATFPEDEFFALDITALLKLAWIRGLEIIPNNPLVPIEILKIEPLQAYQTFDFFDINYFKKSKSKGFWRKLGFGD